MTMCVIYHDVIVRLKSAELSSLDRAVCRIKLLPVTCFGLPVTCFGLPVTCFGLPVTCFGLPVTCFGLPVTCFGLPVTCFGGHIDVNC